MTTKEASIIEKTIDAYSLALENESDPLERARILVKIADNYYELAPSNHENFKSNLVKAINAYLKALEVRTLEEFRTDYAMTQNNLGAAYGTLAGVEDKAENCKSAIQAYLQALRVSTLEQFPMDYAMTQNNLGNAYRNMAEVEDKAENCRKAIEACEKALKVRTLERYPMDYAETQNILGSAYSTLAGAEKLSVNCERAKQAFGSAIEVWIELNSPQNRKLIEEKLAELNLICNK